MNYIESKNLIKNAKSYLSSCNFMKSVEQSNWEVDTKCLKMYIKLVSNKWGYV